MSAEKKLNRREFLRGAAMTAVGVLAASCAQPTPEVIEKEIPVEKIVKETVLVEKEVPIEKVVKETVVVEKQVAVEKVVTATPMPSKYKEAPMLADLVKAGKLPPVDERLPTNPMVPPMVEGVGKFGGTIRRAHKGVSDVWGPRKICQQSVLTFNPPDLSYIPQLMEAWEQNANSTQFTFKMRKGTKWSDGASLDSDSAKWWYQYVLLNKTLTPAAGATWSTTTDGIMTPMTMEFPDKTTVVIKFADPNPLFPGRMATLSGVCFAPGHYLKQFHVDTVDSKAALEEAVKQANFNTWDQLFSDRNNWNMSPDRPVANPWLPKTQMSDELFLMERNPYFWQVDEEGNQLPYVDLIQHRLFNTQDAYTMWILNGEIDWQGRHNLPADYTLFKENEEKGDYKVADVYNSYYDSVVPNQSCKDKRLRAFNQNRDVRIALSHAINRELIADLIYDGRVTIGQWGPVEISPLYSEEQHVNHIEYDPKKANDMLDKTVYNKKDSEGFRLWPDSTEPVSFIIETYIADPGSESADELEVIVKDFAAVGIKATWKQDSRALSEERLRANEPGWYYYWAGRGAVPMLEPFTFLGQQGDIPFVYGFGLWRGNPTDANAEEPPADHYIRKIWALWDQIAAEPDEKMRNALFAQIVDIYIVELPWISTVGWPVQPYIVKNGLHNFKGGYYDDNTLRHDGFLMPWTFYWDEPDKHE